MVLKTLPHWNGLCSKLKKSLWPHFWSKKWLQGVKKFVFAGKIHFPGPIVHYQAHNSLTGSQQLCSYSLLHNLNSGCGVLRLFGAFLNHKIDSPSQDEFFDPLQPLFGPIMRPQWLLSLLHRPLQKGVFSEPSSRGATFHLKMPSLLEVTLLCISCIFFVRTLLQQSRGCSAIRRIF